ncbi:hypothetical protein [Salipaludibacillus sp. CF4.18]|uniref:hypothetical protein n=1 Tax=Salipaludibacillus sp. CF4.18 TaxID=3373081 RepID=UPI003EE71CF5
MRIRYLVLLALGSMISMIGCAGNSVDENSEGSVENDAKEAPFEIHTREGEEKVQKAFESGNLETQLYEYEKRFSDNSYKGDIDAEEQAVFIEGTGEVNVLISAPHATSHRRDGDKKDADIYTGSMALMVQEFTGAHVIFSTYEGEDGNYVIGGTYKEKIGEIIEEHDVDLVLDLHGAAENRDFDVDIGTNYGETVRNEWVEGITTIFSGNNINRVYENDTFPASTEGTVTKHTWNHYQTEAMQLEIHRNYRNPRNDLDSYYEALKSLVLFVENIG